MNETQEPIAIADKPKDYAGLLWIFLAGALGFTLFCATSAIALSDPTLPTPIVIEPGNIANLAFSNLNTAAALTAESFQDLVATSTSSATFTPTASQTASPTASPTRTRTPFIPSRTPTKQEQPPPRATIVLPTATRTQKPTNTPIIIIPITGTATVADPPTETPVPEPSSTPIPPPTSTPLPPPTIPPPTPTP